MYYLKINLIEAAGLLCLKEEVGGKFSIKKKFLK